VSARRPARTPRTCTSKALRVWSSTQTTSLRRAPRHRFNLPPSPDGRRRVGYDVLRAIARAVHHPACNVVPTVHVGQDLDWMQLIPHVTKPLWTRATSRPSRRVGQEEKRPRCGVGGQVGALGAMLRARQEGCEERRGDGWRALQAKELKTEA
jgi:hypothetical protein